MDSSERIRNLIARFVLKYNYWGYLFSRIRRKPSKLLPSIMGVVGEPDGTLALYFHPDLVDNTDDENLIKVIEHEGGHILNKHIPRLIRILANETSDERKKFKSRVYGIASDLTVNQQFLPKEKHLHIGGRPWPLVTPETEKLPPDKITEWYFHELIKRNDNESKSGQCEKCGKQKGEGEGGGSKGKNQNQEDKCQCDGGGENVDDHNAWTKNLKGVSDLSSLSRKIDHHVQNIIKESVKTFNKDRGRLPGNIADLIQGALEPPKAPYYQIIKKLVRGSRFSKFIGSPTKINRKRTYVFTIGDDNLPTISPFPGKKRDLTFDIVIGIDTSGSMQNDEIREGLSGVKNIIEKDRYCFATVLEVDTQVEKEYEVKKLRDIQFNIKGRGGTTLLPGLIRAKELGCDVCLFFTDAGCENINSVPRKLLPKRIIWVVPKQASINHIDRTGYIVRID